MKTLLILAGFVGICLCVALPPSKLGGKCGAVAAAKQNLLQMKKAARSPLVTMDYVCEMCLDLVLIAESYAECDEAEMEEAMDNDCDKRTHNKAMDVACRQMIDKIAHEVIEDTSQDPTAVCYKVIHKECHYGF